jgi:hypothetical protein
MKSRGNGDFYYSDDVISQKTHSEDKILFCNHITFYCQVNRQSETCKDFK